MTTTFLPNNASDSYHAIDFASATAEWDTNGVSLAWTTTREEGTAAFDVKRSTSIAGSYETVARVYSSGSSAGGSCSSRLAGS